MSFAPKGAGAAQTIPAPDFASPISCDEKISTASTGSCSAFFTPVQNRSRPPFQSPSSKVQFTPHGSPAELPLLRMTFNPKTPKNPRISDGKQVTPARLALDPTIPFQMGTHLEAKAKRKNVILISHLHGLISMGIMHKDLRRLGIKKMLFCGKPYSADLKTAVPWIEQIIGKGHFIPFGPIAKPYELEKQTVASLNEAFKRTRKYIAADKSGEEYQVVFLSDGGILPDEKVLQSFEGIPLRIVQQTTSGRKRLMEANPPPCRWLDLSATAPKQIEDGFIGQSNDAIIDAIIKKLAPRQKDIGIIGLGRIGLNTAKCLIERGYRVSYYDPENREAEIKGLGLESQLIKCNSSEELIKRNSVIVGATGKDTLKGLDLKNIMNGNKVFMSVSSGDVEFRSVMMANDAGWINQAESKQNQLCDLKYESSDHTTGEKHILTIAYAGCPVTFMDPATGQPHPEPTPKDVIANTRNLLAAGVYSIINEPIIEADRHRDKKYPHPMPFSDLLSKLLIKNFYTSLPDDHQDKEYVRKSGERLGMITPAISHKSRRQGVVNFISLPPALDLDEATSPHPSSMKMKQVSSKNIKALASLVTNLFRKTKQLPSSEMSPQGLALQKLLLEKLKSTYASLT